MSNNYTQRALQLNRELYQGAEQTRNAKLILSNTNDPAETALIVQALEEIKRDQYATF